MPTTSQDLLFIVLALCALVLTFFISWTLYYLAVSFRDIYTVTRGIRKRVDDLFNFVERLKNKTQNTAATAAAVSKAAIDIIDYVKRKRTSKKSSKKKDTADSDT